MIPVFRFVVPRRRVPVEPEFPFREMALQFFFRQRIGQTPGDEIRGTFLLPVGQTVLCESNVIPGIVVGGLHRLSSIVDEFLGVEDRVGDFGPSIQGG